MATRNLVEVRIFGDDFAASLKGMDPRFATKLVSRTLLGSGQLLQKTVQTKAIKRGGKGKPLPHKLTSRTGTLRRSIRVNVVGLTIVDVGTDLAYGPPHERGGLTSVPAHSRRVASGRRVQVRAHQKHFPKRPFMQPGLDLSRPGMAKIMAAEWARVANRARVKLPPGGKVAR